MRLSLPIDYEARFRETRRIKARPYVWGRIRGRGARARYRSSTAKPPGNARFRTGTLRRDNGPHRAARTRLARLRLRLREMLGARGRAAQRWRAVPVIHGLRDRPLVPAVALTAFASASDDASHSPDGSGRRLGPRDVERREGARGALQRARQFAGSTMTMSVAPRPKVSGSYISSALAGPATKRPGVVARAT